MRVLALDTTTRTGSVALVQTDRILMERGGDPARTHAERLPADILALLDEAGWTTADLDLMAVASGPGSFTGLRIGIATIQGLAVVAGRPMVAVSALEAMAGIAGHGEPAGTLVGAWMDAHRGEVFSALYRVADAAAGHPDPLIECEPPSVELPAAALRRWSTHGDLRSMRLVGDGAVRYAALVQGSVGTPGAGTDRMVPWLAGAIGLIAAVRAARGETIEPAAVRPLYVRRPDAEVDREKRALAAGGAGERRA